MRRFVFTLLLCTLLSPSLSFGAKKTRPKSKKNQISQNQKQQKKSNSATKRAKPQPVTPSSVKVAPPEPIVNKPVVPPPKTFTQKALAAGDSIASAVDKTAEAIDLGLAGKKYTRKPNKSSANISQLVTWTEGGEVKTSTDFGLNLRLPNVERRWQLRFSSYDEEKESRDLSQQRVRTRGRERDYGAGLMFFEKLGNVKTSFLPRLRLKDPLEMNYILRLESEAHTKRIKFFPRLDLFADALKGTGEYLSLELQSSLSKRLDLVLTNTEEYQEKQNLFTTQHGFSLDYALSENRGVGGGVIGVSTNKPSFHLETLTVSTVYAQQIVKDRLNYSLTPFLTFAKTESFKGKSGVSLNIDLTF